MSSPFGIYLPGCAVAFSSVGLPFQLLYNVAALHLALLLLMVWDCGESCFLWSFHPHVQKRIWTESPSFVAFYINTYRFSFTSSTLFSRFSADPPASVGLGCVLLHRLGHHLSVLALVSLHWRENPGVTTHHQPKIAITVAIARGVPIFAPSGKPEGIFSARVSTSVEDFLYL